MTESTMLRQAAIGKLMDIQEYCNRIVNLDVAHPDVHSAAHYILGIIKAN